MFIATCTTKTIFPKRLFCLTLLLFIFPLFLFPQKDDSEAKWRQALGGKVLSVPVAQASSVVMVTDEGMLRCFSYTGRPLWKFDAQGKLTPFVSRSREGTSYICRTDGTFMAINRSGRLLWTKKLPHSMIAAPLIGWDGRIFIPLAQNIICVSAAADQRWNLKLEAKLALPPVPDGRGGLLAALMSNTVISVSPTGQIQKTSLSQKPALLIDTSKDMADFLVYYRDGTGEFRRFSGEISPLPKMTGQPIAGARNDTCLALLLDQGTVITMSLEHREILWEASGPLKIPGESMDFPISGKTNTQPLLLFDERGIYALRLSGVAGFTQDGRRLWSIAVQGAASSPCFSDEGLVYSGGNDWILYAYKLEDRVKSVASMLYGPEPEGRYGLDTLAGETIDQDPFFFEENNMSNSLSHIEALITEGNVGEEEPDSIRITMKIARTGQRSRGMPFQLQPLIQPFYRVWAIRLLARLGSRETIPFLTGLAKNEEDHLVISVIADAIGHIGVDPEGLALQTFDILMHSGDIRNDERVMASIAEAIGALCRFSGPPLSGAGIPYLVKLAEFENAPVVRVTAQREIQRIME